MTTETEKAIFAAGCFWGVEATFQDVGGVLATRVGYTGGRTENPDYKSVCRGNTGHAEAVEVTFDPAAVSYEALLAVFWRLHDPTQVDRQGADVGRQYRSAVFFTDEAQRQTAEASRRQRQGEITGDIATEITAAGVFWEAEDYHQSYVRKKRANRFF